jgi:hypothetical protein
MKGIRAYIAWGNFRIEIIYFLLAFLLQISLSSASHIVYGLGPFEAQTTQAATTVAGTTAAVTTGSVTTGFTSPVLNAATDHNELAGWTFGQGDSHDNTVKLGDVSFTGVADKLLVAIDTTFPGTYYDIDYEKKNLWIYADSELPLSNEYGRPPLPHRMYHLRSII